MGCSIMRIARPGSTLERLMLERGGKCEECGTDKTRLSFHHPPGVEKLAQVSFIAQQKDAYEEAKREADKCELLCLTCHGWRHS